MAPAEAARLARVRLGGLAEVKEDCRESWGLSRIEALLGDITYGLRKLSKSPVFTSTAICVLALSIGDATLFFALVRSVLLAPLPYRSPEELVMNVFSRAMGRLIEVDSDSHVLWVAGCGPEGVSRECRAGGPGILDIFPRAGGTPLACRAGRRGAQRWREGAN